jgi:hypothetical protein
MDAGSVLGLNFQSQSQTISSEIQSDESYLTRTDCSTGAYNEPVVTRMYIILVHTNTTKEIFFTNLDHPSNITTMAFSTLFRASFWATLLISSTSAYTPSTSQSLVSTKSLSPLVQSSNTRRQWLTNSFATLPVAAAFWRRPPLPLLLLHLPRPSSRRTMTSSTDSPSWCRPIGRNPNKPCPIVAPFCCGAIRWT